MSINLYYHSPYSFQGSDSKDLVSLVDDLLLKVDSEKISFFLDANICIYMRELYASPKRFNLRNPDFTQSLIKFISFIKENRFSISPSLGADESSRDIGTFLLNQEKLTQTIDFIGKLFSMTQEELQKYIVSDSRHELINGANQLLNSKITAVQQDSLFRNNFLPLFYLAFMKLYLIIESNDASDRIEMFNKFINFMRDDLNFINSTLLQLAIYYIGNKNNEIPFIKKIKESKEFNKFLHTLFNCSIDLSLPMLISYVANQNNLVPIIVTADKDLESYLLSVAKVHVKLHYNGSYRPMTQIVFDGTLFTSEEIKIMRHELNTISVQRASAGVDVGISKEKMLELCRNFEHELKEKFFIPK